MAIPRAWSETEAHAWRQLTAGPSTAAEWAEVAEMYLRDLGQRCGLPPDLSLSDLVAQLRRALADGDIAPVDQILVTQLWAICQDVQAALVAQKVTDGDA